MANPTLMVMAAGIGSRYGGFKQIDPIGPNGEIIVDYAIYDALRAGFAKVVFIIRKDIEQAFKEKVGRTVEKRVKTLYIYQELNKIPEGFSVPDNRTKPWGTAHAILCCKDVVDSPFAVINADDFYGRSAYEILCNYLKQARDKGGLYDYCLVGYILGKTLSDYGHVARGVCNVHEDGFLSGITERAKIQKSTGTTVRQCCFAISTALQGLHKTTAFGCNERIVSTENGGNWVEISKDSVVSMNMWGFTPSLFSEVDQRFSGFLKENINNPKAEYLLPVVIGELVKENKAKVKVLPTEEDWFGITYKQDIQKVRESIRVLIDRGVYPRKLWG